MATTTRLINCYARVADDCLQGQPVISVGVDYEMSDDGTYVKEIDAVCCDRCYVALGTPLREHLTLAILSAKGVHIREERVKASDLEPGDLWSTFPTEWAMGVIGNRVSLAIRSGNESDDAKLHYVYRIRIERSRI